MPALRHAAGEKFIEARMIDECTITRDKEQVFDAVLDEETGELVEPTPDSGIVYRGKCLVKGAKPDEVNQGGFTTDLPTHTMLIPKKVVNVRFMDRVTVRGAREPGFANDIYEVRRSDESTHSVYRRIWMRKIGVG